ncbi:MAG: T9SS type A sorting domain-containing protein [Bacteroidales bacterium]|nr:T9SS type A sorting domain-containing protein [Bacteroidales bacterium]
MKNKHFALFNVANPSQNLPLRKLLRCKLTALKLSSVLLLGLGMTGLQAQEAIPAAGGDASGSGGSAGYSVGQIVYTTHPGTNGSVAQGVQQPYEISVISGVEEAGGLTLTILVHPNPVYDLLMLKADNYDQENLSYHLFDINGKLLENKMITANETTIAMSGFLPATYFLKITRGCKEVKTFEIIKH